jgi:UDP-glucose 4-epimerase
MRIVVTGAAGFLGRQVATHLVHAGHEVTGLDLLGIDQDSFKSVQVDFLDRRAMAEALSGQDAVCHLGAIGDVYLAAEQPETAARVNVAGSASVAMAALEAGVRVVYASTWEVYGVPLSQPITEDHRCAPDHPYNITKLAGEQMVLSAVELHGLSAVALRLGTAYGPGMRPNSVFRVFADRARNGAPLVIQGDGSQGRQFTHASDIGAAFEMACRSDESGEAFNIVAPEMVSIARLAEVVVARYPTELTFGAPRPGDIATAMVSAEKAMTVFGWRAQVEFQHGIEDVFADTDKGAKVA